MRKKKFPTINVHFRANKFYMKELDKIIEAGKCPPGVSDRTAMLNWLVATYLLQNLEKQK